MAAGYHPPRYPAGHTSNLLSNDFQFPMALPPPVEFACVQINNDVGYVMKSVFISAAVAAAFALAMPAAAMAQEPGSAFSFNATITNDYVWRGFSQSNEDPAIQGGIDFTSGGFYAGTWASTVDFGDGTEAEWDFYVGATGTTGVIDWDLAVTYYTYVDAPSGADYNFVEFKGALSRSFDAVTVGAALHFSPDFYGADETATYVEANLEYALNDKVSLSAGVGRQFLDVTGDYTAWNIGGAYALTDKLALDVRYWDASVDGPLSDARLAVSLGVAF